MNPGKYDIGIPMREKIWPERSDAEKLEALRDSVIRLLARTAVLETSVMRLTGHFHAPSGAVTVPLREEERYPSYNGTPTGLRDKE